MSLTEKNIADIRERVIGKVSERRSIEASTLTHEIRKRDARIADMAESHGWRDMVDEAEKIIVSMLEPVEIESLPPNTDIAFLGAMSLARAMAIETIRQFVEIAESARRNRAIERKQEKEGVSGK